MLLLSRYSPLLICGRRAYSLLQLPLFPAGARQQSNKAPNNKSPPPSAADDADEGKTGRPTETYTDRELHNMNRDASRFGSRVMVVFVAAAVGLMCMFAAPTLFKSAGPTQVDRPKDAAK